MTTKTFKVTSVSSHPDRLGLIGVVLIAADGEAWHVGIVESAAQRRGDTVEIPVTGDEVPDFASFRFQLPVKLLDAPPHVVAEVRRYARDRETPKHDEARHAIKEARLRVISVGCADIFSNGFVVVIYTDAELVEGGGHRDWCGHYVSGSIDSIHGLTVGLNIDTHLGFEHMADTLCHECGHGLFELLDAESQAEWLAVAKDAEYGPEESFADHFMLLARGDRRLMEFADVFERLTAPVAG